MNTYQVILGNSDILKINAGSIGRDGVYLCFYSGAGPHEDGSKLVAQFVCWNGWNLMEEVQGDVWGCVPQLDLDLTSGHD